MAIDSYDAFADELHQFWFGSLNTAGLAAPEQRSRWFEASDRFDELCRQRYGPVLRSLEPRTQDSWLNTPKRALAYVLLHDQIPRNLYRGTAQAFAYDERAREIARRAVTQGLDTALGVDECAFLYLPFEHSEARLDQFTAVGLFASLRDRVEPEHKSIAGSYLRHAQQHRDTILRFGRFPYRNKALGRTSTRDERSYLERS
ncbi:MAG: DUF924 family protein [Pseudomonadota bacterium]